MKKAKCKAIHSYQSRCQITDHTQLCANVPISCCMIEKLSEIPLKWPPISLILQYLLHVSCGGPPRKLRSTKVQFPGGAISREVDLGACQNKIAYLAPKVRNAKSEIFYNTRSEKYTYFSRDALYRI